jgi:hypothetical protein
MSSCTASIITSPRVCKHSWIAGALHRIGVSAGLCSPDRRQCITRSSSGIAAQTGIMTHSLHSCTCSYIVHLSHSPARDQSAHHQHLTNANKAPTTFDATSGVLSSDSARA